MKKLYLLIVLSLILIKINAQTESTFLNKANQHSLSFEYKAISYSYAYRVKPHVIFGIRAQIGLGLSIMLASTPTYIDFGYGNGPEKVTPSGYQFEVLKLQIFYRYAMSNSFYFNVGPVAALCIAGGAEWEQPFRVGIETSVLYAFRKMHLGIRLAGVYNFDPFNSHPGMTSKTSHLSLCVTPIVIGINF